MMTLEKRRPVLRLPPLKVPAIKILNLARADLYIRDETNFYEGLLTQHLRWWVRVLSVGELPGTINFLLALLRQSVTALVVSVSVMVQMVYDTAVSGSMFGFRIALAVYTSLVVIVIFLQRRHEIKTCLCQLVQVSATLDLHAHAQAKIRMDKTARRCAKLSRFYEVYAWLTEGAVIVALLVRKPAWQEYLAAGVQSLIGGDEDVWANVFRWCYLPFQCFTGLCAVVTDYTIVVLILVIYLSMAVMYDTVGEALQTSPCGTLWAQQQSLLTQASLKMDAAVADLLPQVLIVSVVVPLLCTVEVVLNGLQADLFAVGMAPLVLAVFVPFCLVGDAMSAARLRLTDHACAGPWLEESVHRRKLRLGMVQLSQGIGGALRGRGIGQLDRKTCGSALKSWFSFLQVLMNLQ